MMRQGVILTRKPSVRLCRWLGSINMRRAGARLIVAAILALAGCKSMDPKGDDKAPAGLGAGRTKTKDGKDAKETKGALAKGPTWLDDVDKLPGAGTGVPKSTGPTNPKDKNFDAKTAAQDVLGGRVLDPYGRPARNVYVRLEQVGVPAGPGEIGIYTDEKGYFSAKGLQVGQSYEVTAIATPQDGKPLSGSVQTKVPNVILTILLRDALPPPTGGFPPTPNPTDGNYIPPMGYAPINQPKPPGDAWSPGGPTNAVPPATIGGVKPPAMSGGTPGAITPPDAFVPSPAPKPTKPENVADGPKDLFKPPPVSIPGPGNGGAPPVPPLQALPPSFPVPGGKSSMGPSTGRAAGKFTLLDTLERPWDSDMVSPGSLALVEFTTSTCAPCKQVIPVLKDLQSRYGARGLQVMGVMCDNLPQKERARTAAKYGRDHNLNYALYVEPIEAGSVRDRFDVESYPHAILLNATGKVLWQGHPGTQRTQLEAAVKQGLGK